MESEQEDIMLPGFRFHPTDEELVGFYLKRKIQQKPSSVEIIKQLDIYKFDPWDLPKMAAGEKEWYFFCPRDRKYRNSARPNRVTAGGFWKATGTDRPIYSSEGRQCIGLKKSLVFYRGRAAKGSKTDWMMHEFRLPSVSDKTVVANDCWALCRIFKKSSSCSQRALSRCWMPLTSENNLVQPCVSLPQSGQHAYNVETIVPSLPLNFPSTSPLDVDESLNDVVTMHQHYSGYGGMPMHFSEDRLSLMMADNVDATGDSLLWQTMADPSNVGLSVSLPINYSGDAWKTYNSM